MAPLTKVLICSKQQINASLKWYTNRSTALFTQEVQISSDDISWTDVRMAQVKQVFNKRRNIFTANSVIGINTKKAKSFA